jgi:hypothetical protein
VSFARLTCFRFFDPPLPDGLHSIRSSAVQKVRSRLINFRVTDEELEQLKTAATVQGSRCLSEFARLVMLRTAASGQFPAAPESPDGKLSLFDRRLNVLEANVARLVDALASEKAVGSKSEN